MSRKMLERYSHASNKAKREAVDKLPKRRPRTTQHKSLRVLHRYIHAGTIFEDNASSHMGL